MSHCPVCWEPVTATKGKIRGHFDSIGRARCPMSLKDFALAGDGVRNNAWKRTA
jgi:hypothetical protein